MRHLNCSPGCARKRQSEISNENPWLVLFSDSLWRDTEVKYYVSKADKQEGDGAIYYVYRSDEPDPSVNGKLIYQSIYLAILQRIDLQPGDSLLFRSGDSFFGGMYFFRPQGRDDRPITIGRFGEGPRPIIDGKGAFAVIWLENPANVTVENMELVNRTGNYGIFLEAHNAGELRNIVIQDMDIHDIFVATEEVVYTV